jgi:hypothetical protein
MRDRALFNSLIFKGGSATASAKTSSHSDAMYSHLLGKNVGERKPFELHKVEVSYRIQPSF